MGSTGESVWFWFPLPDSIDRVKGRAKKVPLNAQHAKKGPPVLPPRRSVLKDSFWGGALPVPCIGRISNEKRQEVGV